jgi:hypothetical protein
MYMSSEPIASRKLPRRPVKGSAEVIRALWRLECKAAQILITGEAEIRTGWTQLLQTINQNEAE